MGTEERAAVCSRWWLKEAERRVDSPTSLTAPSVQSGEVYVTIKAYAAVEEDEVSLSEGDAIEVIHKLLDGWWVVR